MKKGVSKITSSVFCFQNPNLLPSFFYSYYLYQMTLQITRHNTYNLKARSQQFLITTSYDLRMIHYFLVPFPTKTSYQAGIVFFIWSFYFFPSHINNIYGAELFSIQTPHTLLSTFPLVLTRRISLAIKASWVGDHVLYSHDLNDQFSIITVRRN